MIVAGIGCRKGVSTAEITAAVKATLETHGLDVGALSSLATTAFKREEKAIFAAGRELGLPVIVMEDEAPLLGVSTHSDLSQALAGVPSVSEAAALAAAGKGARLYGPRIVIGPVTCALAISGNAA
ncbi:cobalamin biosynthesis protein [Mesorhizobium sp. WSM2239]|uniref:Cobalamin biosynthesis protein n=2 Tax=unclassified Mesorhizobium TaxID=325217 RepID=A0AAU8D1A9_9HYPH